MSHLDLITGGAFRGPLAERIFAAPPIATLPEGTEIGRYRLGIVVGQGGSGVVYRAERSDGAFEHVVALKILGSRGGDPAAAAAERNLLARLSHPNIATIHDGGETPSGLLWLAMDYVEGQHLDVHCSSNHCTWAQRLQLLIQVCRALHYAHSHLIVHRDIKPSNVIVTPDGLTKLLDFGIATCEQEGSAAHDAAFTPHFASPEQRSGEPVTTASDVYQLGLLCGLVLDLDGNACAMPSRVRSDLRFVVRRATARTPESRYPTASELANELEAVLGCRPVAARAGSRTHALARFLRRHTLAVSLVATLFATMVAIVMVFTARLEAQRDRAEEEARGARVTSEFMRSMFRLGTPAGLERPLTVIDLLDQNAHRLIGLRSLADRDRAALVEVIADSYLDLGLQDQAARMLGAYRKDAGESVPAAQRARLLLVSARSRIPGDLVAAQADVAAARTLIPQISEPDRSRVVLGWARTRASIERNLGHNEDAIRTLEDAIVSERDRSGRTLELAYALEGLGSLYSITDHGDESFDATREAFLLFKDLLGPAASTTLRIQLDLAIRMQVAGRVDEARKLLEEQDSVVRATSGVRSMEYATLLGSRGYFELSLGNFSEAIPHFRQELELLESAGLGKSRQAATCLNNLAISLAQNDELPEAIDAMRRGVEIIQRHWSERDQVTLMHQFNLSTMLCMGSQREESLALFDRTMAIYVGAFGQRNWHAAAMAKDLIGCLMDAGYVKEAGQLLQREVTPDRWAGVPLKMRPEYEALFRRATLPLPAATE